MREKQDGLTKVIIPAATYVPQELQSIGKLPAIVYPFNKRTVFEYLYEQYGENSDITILCYEGMEEVQERLSAFLSDEMQIKKIPELRDLGYTIYCGLQDISGEVIINFADTIVTDNIGEIQGDCFYCSEDYLTEKWTYFDEESGRISSICDKQMGVSDEKKRFFVGVFKLADAQYFRECLEFAFENPNAKVSTFYFAIMLYSKKYPMQPINTLHWLDIGHSENFQNASLEVKSREFNHITIDKDRGILKKTSEEKEKFIGEIQWYLKLPQDIEYVRPRIFSYSTSYNDPYVYMEYYAYHTIHELFLYGNLNQTQWRNVLSRILFVCQDFKRYSVRNKEIPKALKEVYLDKTVERLQRLKTDEKFAVFFGNSFEVNGVRYQSLDSILEILSEMIPQKLLDVDEFSIIHGDLCFANIMIDSNLSFVKLIDPRGKFGIFDIYGDYRYEVAKLMHSIDGKYDYIIKDLFNLSCDLENRTIQYAILDGKKEYDLYHIFKQVFKNEIGDELQQFELIEALLFLSMIPLHGESVRHQYAMLGTGIEILSRVVDITCEV